MAPTVEVNTNFSTVGVRSMPARTFRVPVRAGSTTSFCPSLIFSGIRKGEATWKTTRQPSIAASKEPSASRSASNSSSVPGSWSRRASRGATFASLPRERTVVCTR